MSATNSFRVSDLDQNRPTTFDLRPDEQTRRALAVELGVLNIRKLSFQGEIKAQGKRDWQLTGTLGATVVQPCVVTLDPVTTRIDTEVSRFYIADFDTPEENEAEMVQDETEEPLGSHIDPGAVMAEALAIALPDYPRKESVELGQAVYAEDGATPLRDEDVKPFGALAELRDKLKKPDDT